MTTATQYGGSERWRAAAVIPIIIAPWIFGFLVLAGHLSIAIALMFLTGANGLFCLYRWNNRRGSDVS
jgi:hypothetical protein